MTEGTTLGVHLGVSATCAICISLPISYLVLSHVRRKRVANMLLGARGKLTTSAIVGEKAEEVDNEDHSILHAVHYHFEAEQSDGTKCVVVVKKRRITSGVAHQIEASRRVRVRYLPEDPRCCRLEVQAKHEAHSLCLGHRNAWMIAAIGVAFAFPTLVLYHIGRADNASVMLTFWASFTVLSFLLLIMCRSTSNSQCAEKNILL